MENPPQSEKLRRALLKIRCRENSVTKASATFPRSDFQYNKTVLRNDNISFLINFNIVNNHLRRIILFKIRAAGKLERNYSSETITSSGIVETPFPNELRALSTPFI